MSDEFLNDLLAKRLLPSPISKNHAITVIDAIYLGGHRAIQPDLVPVRLHVGDLLTVVELLEEERHVFTWPSSMVFDLACVHTSPFYGREVRGELTAEDMEIVTHITPAGCCPPASASFLLLQPREVGGGVLNVRFQFADHNVASWFVGSSRRSLGID